MACAEWRGAPRSCTSQLLWCLHPVTVAADSCLLDASLHIYLLALCSRSLPKMSEWGFILRFSLYDEQILLMCLRLRKADQELPAHPCKISVPGLHQMYKAGRRGFFLKAKRHPEKWHLEEGSTTYVSVFLPRRTWREKSFSSWGNQVTLLQFKSESPQLHAYVSGG